MSCRPGRGCGPRARRPCPSSRRRGGRRRRGGGDDHRGLLRSWMARVRLRRGGPRRARAVHGGARAMGRGAGERVVARVVAVAPRRRDGVPADGLDGDQPGLLGRQGRVRVEPARQPRLAAAVGARAEPAEPLEIVDGDVAVAPTRCGACRASRSAWIADRGRQVVAAEVAGGHAVIVGAGARRLGRILVASPGHRPTPPRARRAPVRQTARVRRGDPALRLCPQRRPGGRPRVRRPRAQPRLRHLDPRPGASSRPRRPWRRLAMRAVERDAVVRIAAERARRPHHRADAPLADMVLNAGPRWTLRARRPTGSRPWSRRGRRGARRGGGRVARRAAGPHPRPANAWTSST